MSSLTKDIGRGEVGGDTRSFDDVERTSVLRELDAILNSSVFQPSKRCQEFLSYVVHHRLERNDERLKERTIGMDLYQRSAGYATGDDPVVRIHAGEVRKRLVQYYQTTPNNSPVRIELHLGKYAPEFKWAHLAPHLGDSLASQSGSEVQETAHRMGNVQESAEAALPPLPETKRSSTKHKQRLLWVWWAGGIALLAGFALMGSDRKS